jgi:tetratricopeptide (TPR) repeat protein
MPEPSLPHSVKKLNWLHVAGKYAQLIEADRDNLATLRAEFRDDHKYVGNAISQLAWSLYENGDFAAAEDELAHGMVVDVADVDDLKERNASFLLDLANIYLATKREEKATTALERANELMKSMRDIPALRMGISLSYSARILLGRRQLAEAERLIQEAIILARKECQPPNRALGIFYHRLSEVYAVQGKLVEAIETMGTALNTYLMREAAYYANSLSLLGGYMAICRRRSRLRPKRWQFSSAFVPPDIETLSLPSVDSRRLLDQLRPRNASVRMDGVAYQFRIAAVFTLLFNIECHGTSQNVNVIRGRTSPRQS